MDGLRIDVTRSMSLSVERTIDAQRDDLHRVLPSHSRVESALPHRTHCEVHDDLAGTRGHRISQFPILREGLLGRGSSAQVFRAVRLTDLRLCAEKSFVVGDALKRQQMVREVELLQSLSLSPAQYVVQLYGVYLHPRDGTLSLLLEYMDLGSLQYLVNAGGTSDVSLLSSLARQLTAGLAFLHRHRLVHRDVKPSNLLLSSSQRVVKLSDFGIAKAMDLGLSLAESFVGTYEFMAPERLHGERYGFVSDVWSLGVSLRYVAHGTAASSASSSRSSALPIYKKKKDFWEILQEAQRGESNRERDRERETRDAMVSKQFADFVATATRVDERERVTAERLLTHTFLRDAAPRLSTQHVQHLQDIAQRERDRVSERTREGESQQDKRRAEKDEKALIARLVRDWTALVRELFDLDGLDDDDERARAVRAEDLQTLSVTKERVAQLARDLRVDEKALSRAFRKALRATRRVVGDRLRFMQTHANETISQLAEREENDPETNCERESVRESPRQVEEKESEREGEKREMHSERDCAESDAVRMSFSASQRLRVSRENCFASVSMSIDKSMRSLCVAEDEGKTDVVRERCETIPESKVSERRAEGEREEESEQDERYESDEFDEEEDMYQSDFES